MMRKEIINLYIYIYIYIYFRYWEGKRKEFRNRSLFVQEINITEQIITSSLPPFTQLLIEQKEEVTKRIKREALLHSQLQ